MRLKRTAAIVVAICASLSLPLAHEPAIVAAAVPAMPVISRGVPAYTNDTCGGSYPPGLANDGSYDTQWRGCNSPSAASPTYLAYDLSGVPAANRGRVIVAWYNDPMTFPYDHTYVGVHPCCTWLGYNLPSTYTLQANSAPGGSLPSAGWTVLASISTNRYHSREHAIDLTGYNWFRLSVTASDGSSGNAGVSVNLDVHDASAGPQDDWIFFGDSITESGMSHNSLAADGGSGTWAQRVNAANPSYFPAYEDGGIGGTLSADGVNSINTWLALFPGHYVGISYGTNDAGFNVSPTTFYNNYAAMVQAVLNRGKVPVVPKIPWGCTGQVQANGPALNQQLDTLYAAYPQVIHGPDLWSYFQANRGLISGDCVHPTNQGYVGFRQQWANAMLTNVYGATPPALQISAVQATNIYANSASISWTTNNAANGRVDYGTTTAYGGVAVDSTSRTAHTLALSGLTANTTYHYKVTSVDTYGQSAASPDAIFTTTASAPPAAIAFRAATQNDQSGTSTSLVLGVPAGVVNGDALYAVVIYEDGAVPSDPAGWTLLGEAVNPNNNRTRVLRRIAASEPASYRWTFSLGMHVGGAMVAYSGVDPTTPEDATAASAIGMNTTPTTPSRTTLTANAWLVSTYGTPGWGQTTTTAPAGMSLRTSFGGTSSFGFADQPIAAPSATGTRSWSTNAATPWAALAFALRPAASGP